MITIIIHIIFILNHVILGYESVVQRLIELKCDIDASDTNKHTPLHLACLHGNQKCVVSDLN